MTLISPAVLYQIPFGLNPMGINLNGGIASIPPGVYFKGSFSFTTWIKLQSFLSTSYLTVFDFYASGNRVLLYLTPTNQIGLYFASDADTFFIINSPSQLVLNKWSFISVTFKNNIAKLYTNGILLGQGVSTYSPPRVTSSPNLFGSIQRDESGLMPNNLDASLFDIKIYSREVSQTDLLAEYYNQTGISFQVMN